MKEIIFVYNSLSGGGITSSLIDVLNLIDFSNTHVTLYIRRDDYLNFKQFIPSYVNLIFVHNSYRKKEFDNSFFGKLARLIYKTLKKRHKYLAKRFSMFYLMPKQRKKESSIFQNNQYDICICYSSDSDDPIFCYKHIKAKHKYVFIHQSTRLSKKNIHYMSKYDAIILVNPLLINWASELFTNATIISISNYVDNKKVVNLSHEEIDLNLDIDADCILLTCGRLVKSKGIDLLINTSKLLKDKGLSFKWFWVGDGADADYLKNQILVNGLDNNVIPIGEKKNPYPYFRICNYYVHTSLSEAFGLVIVEAIALSKIYISTKTIGAEYIKSNYGCGILTDFSPEEISDTIYQLQIDSDLRTNELHNVALVNFEEKKNEYIKKWNYLLANKIDLLKDDNKN